MKYKHYGISYRIGSVALWIRHKLYRRLIGNAGSALEFGVGHGYFMGFCKNNGINYTGVDFCPDLATDGVIDAEIPEEMNRVPSGYDLIFAEHFIEHLRDYEAVVEFLEGCCGRLNKGGRLLLLYPNMNKHFWHDPTHQYPTNKHRIGKCLIDAGFEVFDSGDYAHFFVGFFKTLPLRLIGCLMPANARVSLHFCVHSYTTANLIEMV